MDKRVLVTGGAGFIGSHLTRYLAKLPDTEVVVIDDLSGGFEENVPAGIEFIRESVCNVDAINHLFQKKRFTHVYHLAAYAAEGLSHFIRRFNYQNNLVGSVNIINACVNYNVSCLVFSSSIAVYGAGQAPLREEMAPRPEDPYGVAKYAVELDLRAAHEMFGLNYVVFRPHNVYGEFQNIGDKYRNVIGIFMNQVMRGEPMTIFGNGEQMRAFSYVGDIIPIIARSAWHPPAYQRVFNIGADSPTSVNELSRAVATAMNRDNYPVVHYPARNEVLVAFSDHAAVRNVFGEAPQTPLGLGLGKMAAWVKTVGARSTRAFNGIEVEKNLPPSWRQ